MTTIDPSIGSAVALYDRGQKDQAAELCRQILAVDSRNIESLRMLGVIARDEKRFDQSLQWMDRALRHAPQDPILWFEHGTTLYQQGQLDRAAVSYQRALQFKPDFSEAVLNMGAIFEQQLRFAEALPWAQQAAKLRPKCPKATYNLGNIYRSLGQLEPAVAAYQKSLRFDPDNAKAHWNLAHTYLLQGDFERAWPEHEWRQAAGEVFFDRHDQPRWDGSPLAGRTLLVHAEQGIGDEVMFASCYSELIQQAEHCIFVCDTRLETLLKRSFPQATVYGYRRVKDWQPMPIAEHVDWQIPAGSVPLYLRRKAADFPTRDRFLTADPAACRRWRQRLADLGTGLKIGISWRAGGRPSERRRRTTALAEWKELFELPAVHWVNLQYGDTIDDLEFARQELGVNLHDFSEGDPLVDLDEFAAKLSALDLVVSVGNATVHIAGALGVPAWAIVPPVPGWRWQISGSTVPWYSTVRLYRQSSADDWQDVFGQVRADLLAKMHPAGNRPQTNTRTPKSDAVRQPRLAPHTSHVASGGMWQSSFDAAQFSGEAIPAAMEKALEHHRAGELDRAESIYREILAHLPRNIEAQRLLGLLARQTGRVSLAVSSLRRALAAGDLLPETSLHLAGTLRDAGRLDEALAAYQDAVGRFPDLAEAYLGLGKTLAQLYRPDEAALALQESIRRDDAVPEAHHALGRLLLDDGLTLEAIEACDRALRIRPHYVLAHCTRAVALQKLGRLPEATAALSSALACEPNNRGIQLLLAEMQQAQGRLAEAESLYRRTLAADGQNVAALNNLGLVCQEQGRPDEALQMYDRAIGCNPNFAPAHMNRALACLEQGRFPEGWNDYRWRWHCADGARPRDFFAQPLWDGSSLAGRTILVHGEQSIEQELVLLTCLPDVLAQARQVVVTCDPRLATLMARSFPAAKVFGVARGCEHLWRAPAGLSIDVQVPAGDLPGHLRPALDRFPRQSSHLLSDPLRTAAWRRRLAQLGPGAKVGIAWRVGESSLDRLQRWVPLGHWQSMLNDSRAQLVSLQSGNCDQEVAICRHAGGRLHTFEHDQVFADMDELAALIAALDLVVSVGNVNLHLAAALGTPAWGIFPLRQRWPWLIQQDRIAWYPDVRVFRQQEAGDWLELFERLDEEFLNYLASPRRQRLDGDAISA